MQWWDAWYSVRVDPLPGGGLANFQDIIARKRADEALRESEERFRGTFENVAVGMAHKDADGRFLRVNAKYCEIVGYSRDELLGRTFRDPTHPDDLPVELDRFAAVMRGALSSYSLEKRYVRKDGTAVWVQLTISLQRDAAGAPAYAIVVLEDIAERKRAEAALRERDERLAADLAAMTRLQQVSTRLVPIGDSTPLLEEIVEAAIAITSADMGSIQLLDRATGALKVVASRGFERPFLELFQALDEGQAARVVVEDVTASPVFARTPALDAMLAVGIRAIQSTPLVNRSGRIVGMLSTHYRSPRRPAEADLRVLDLLARQAADWIERTLAEEALRAGQERIRRYFELGLIGMAITSPTKGCLEVSDHMCEMLGYPRAELLELSWAELTHPDDLAADLAQFERVLAGEIDGYLLDKRFVRKDRAILDVTISVQCVRRPDRSVDYFIALVEDVTERKRMEIALRESEERYRSLVSQVRDFAIFGTDLNGVITTWNEGCQYVLGYTEAEFVGLDDAELYTPEHRATGTPAERRRTAAAAGTTRDDSWMVAKGGREFFAVGATAALRDPEGRLVGFSTVMRDTTMMKLSQDELARRGERLERLVTERTEELHQTAERLRLSERMASLGTLTAGLGHDMGNLLLPLDVRLELLLRAELPPELQEHVLGIQKSARYLQRLSKGLRLLATDPTAAPADRMTELGTWWADVAMLLKDALPRSIEFEHLLPAAECWVAIGRTGLTQAVFNLVQNAGDVLRERGIGRVLIAAHELADNWVAIGVTDDGPGMSEEVRRRCLEPYFSTKPLAVSTGMGLPFVHGLVKGAGGRIEIASTMGEGTSITLVLPKARPREEPEASPPALAVEAGGVR
jgi:PAS domain S-box-containing protein